MHYVFDRLSLSKAIVLAVGVALVAVGIPIFGHDMIAELDEIELTAERHADAALDMLEAVHSQSMLHRGQVKDGDPAIETLNGTMEQFSAVSEGVKLWLVMGPKVLAYQEANQRGEIEGPLDEVDAAAIATAETQRSITTDSILRVTRPVVMGEGPARHERCASCHGGLMGLSAGEVIGAYSAAVDLEPALAVWRSETKRRAATSLGVVILTLGLIVGLLHNAALRPLRRLAEVTRKLAQGELDVDLIGKRRVDELGMLARSLEVFRTSLIAKRELEAENALTLRALQQSEARFRDIAGAASDWVWETDSELRFTYLSGRFIDVTGHNIDDMLGRRQDDIVTFDDGDPVQRARRARIDAREAYRGLRCTITAANGKVHICELSGRAIVDDQGNFVGYRGTASDITAQLEAQQRAAYLALHDPLTDLPNRTLFGERLDHAMAIMRRHGGSVAVLCLDLDQFKEVNDTLGHDAGDHLLKEVAARLKDSVRQADTIARLGGDEFAIIQVGQGQPGHAEALCQRLLGQFSQPLRIGDHDMFAGLSIGISLAPADGEEPLQLLKQADIALYRAKAEGRGTYRFFAPEMDAELQVRKTLEHDLRQALAEDQFELVYQPLIDVDKEQVVGVEALLRWCHPSRGSIRPADFIPLAETTGLILPIGEWVLRTACTQAVRWPDIAISVNLSPVQFRHPDLVGLVNDVLEETGLSPNRLELEITEGVLLHDVQATVQTIEGLKQLGVKIAMDDFGRGYSSLGHLHRFPFDRLKVDQSFVHILEQDANAAAIVRSMLGLGKSLGIMTTAEGVETSDQLDFLRSEGCDQVQGYHLGRPQPADQINALLENRSVRGWESVALDQ
ncbi:MAG: EAL domain-containing protein [Alphaproteobacteria bacterium]